MKKKNKFYFFLPFFLGIFLASILGAALALFFLYQLLIRNFERQVESTPTRIFSDLTKISLSDPLPIVEESLQSLGYIYLKHQEQIQFEMHPFEFPLELVPKDYNLEATFHQTVFLSFELQGEHMLLTRIHTEVQDYAHVYLQPELIAVFGPSDKEFREKIRLEDMPSHVWKAVIAIEDQHFLTHPGLDFSGLFRALWVNFKTRSFAQGGSTITQQLVKNLMARNKKNIIQKLYELFLAIALEIKLSKEMILEYYLNEVYLGQVGGYEVHGVGQGAQLFFGKKLQDLNLAESAVIAGLIRGPHYYSPYRKKQLILERMQLVLKRMVETGHISEQEMQEALLVSLRFAPPQKVVSKAPFFSDYVKIELGKMLKEASLPLELMFSGISIYTTLQMRLQNFAKKALHEGIENIQASAHTSAKSVSQTVEGALVAIDPGTGAIQVLLGGKNYSLSNFNRVIHMRRQIGSIFKPIIFLAAILKGVDADGLPYGPHHLVYDGPWKIIYNAGKQKWAPLNFTKKYKGWVSYRTALSQSLNVPTVRVAMEIGLGQVIQTAKQLGIQGELPLLPALSLGITEMTPLEVVQLYGTLANDGVLQPAHAIRLVTNSDGDAVLRTSYEPEIRVAAAAAALLKDMMRDVIEQGTAKSARAKGLTLPAMGKTGTTSFYRDAWFVGSVPSLTTCVWVGWDQQAQNVIKLTGASAALPIWVDFMKSLESIMPQIGWATKDDLQDVTIDKFSGFLASEGCPTEQVLQEKALSSHIWPSATCAKDYPSKPAEVLKVESLQ